MAYRILSLNGGGVRAIFQAAFLNEVQQELGKGWVNNFDLIIGTSAGAIVAAALALDVMHPAEIVRLFQNEISQVFPKKTKKLSQTKAAKAKRLLGKPIKATAKNIKTLVDVFTSGPIYNTAGKLKTILTEKFGDRTLGDAVTGFAVTATDLSDFTVRVFSTLTHELDQSIRVVDAVMASGAAPVYFPCYQFSEHGKDRAYVDGGMWGNSPCLAAITLAYQQADRAFSKLRLVNIGPGENAHGSTRKKHDKMSPFGQVREQYLINMLFAAQMSTSQEAVQRILGKYNTLFVEANLGEKPIDLDDSEGAIAELPIMAKEAARANLQKFNRLIGDD